MPLLLRIRTVGVPCELYLNEHPLLRLGDWGSTASADVPCDLHLEGTQARVRVIVGAGATPATVARPFDPPRRVRDHGDVDVAVDLLPEAQHPRDVMREGGTTLARVALDDATRDRTFPTELRATFVHRPFAPPPLTDPTLPRSWRQDALAVARLFRGLLERGDVDALVSAHALKLEHYASVFRQPLAEVREGFSAFLRDKLESAAWELGPIDESRIDFRLIADGRLVELVNVDWTPTLHFRRVGAPESIAFLPTKIGRIGSTWRSIP